MRVGILIACRMKSQRLPQKALLPIVGKPLIDHLIERVKSAKVPEGIVLCTSTHPDDAVLEEVAQRNAIGFFRGSEEDVMGRFIAAAEKFGFDAVVRVTGDNPLTDPEHIDLLIKSHIETSADFSKVEQLPLGANCEVISLSTLRKAHTLADDPNLSEYMTAYLKQPKYFNINLLEVDPYLKHPQIRLTVDVKEDLQLMEEIYRRLYTEPGKIFSIRQVVELLTQREPELLKINQKVPERALPKILMKGDPIADKPKIVLCGARMDAHAGVVLQIIEEYALYNVVGFVDDDVRLHNTMIQGIPVLGSIDELPQKIPAGTTGFFICSGNNEFRERCYHFLKKQHYKLINVIHPTAHLSSTTVLGEGVFIGAHVVTTNKVHIGNGVLLNTACTIDHDNVVEDFVNISPGCHTSGRVKIKRGTFLGTGVSILPDITIYEYALVGAGAVVTKDVPPQTTVAGVPAVPLEHIALLKRGENSGQRH
ncbi:TPA: NTP transferase domain-containing protein [Candidatus Woesearchaeota archaeon]|nr:NeuD/PglB/VioB family sugar acetyltransferase [Candidatus Woesearchaeota archaeon]HIG93952.1 NTP transferase domain-containing protein [Candidatus Woesearchaeota archaeon]HIH12166.1 NTP transferase domain-containing protein [Candidatus Woesearchaeota archaeon]